MKAILKIGLTGGIGSGKSIVSEKFQALGVPVLDADQISRELVEPGSPALLCIAEQLGDDLLVDGSLDRTKLRTLIFQSPECKKKLEAILHPLIFKTMEQRISRLDAAYCILALPLLLETHAQAFVDRILVVDCPIELQYSRVQKRDGLETAEIERIIRSQASREERLAAADDVLENQLDLDSLQSEIQRLHLSYLNLAKH